MHINKWLWNIEPNPLLCTSTNHTISSYHFSFTCMKHKILSPKLKPAQRALSLLFCVCFNDWLVWIQLTEYITFVLPTTVMQYETSSSVTLSLADRWNWKGKEPAYEWILMQHILHTWIEILISELLMMLKVILHFHCLFAVLNVAVVTRISMQLVDTPIVNYVSYLFIPPKIRQIFFVLRVHSFLELYTWLKSTYLGYIWPVESINVVPKYKIVDIGLLNCNMVI